MNQGGNFHGLAIEMFDIVLLTYICWHLSRGSLHSADSNQVSQWLPPNLVTAATLSSSVNLPALRMRFVSKDQITASSRHSDRWTCIAPNPTRFAA